MNETTKTLVFVAIAAGLAGTAFLTRPQVNRATSEFVEERAPFYPDVNPDGVKGLEVTAYDKEKGELDSFSVKLQNGVWIIPSHNNYPADAAERLKKTAGAVVSLQKDTVVSGGKELHKECGLIDPADTSGDAESWGTRVKLLDVNGNVVSDLLIGKNVPDKTDFKFVRVPDKDRVYQVKCSGLDLTTRFADWIDTDLITDSAFDFDKLVINDYKLERAGNRVRINDQGVISLAKDDKGKWKLGELKEGEETDETKAGDLATAVSDLKILGVRPKPPGLTADLNILEQQFAAESMISRGFFPTEDGRVVSNEGEVSCETKDGIRYTLRFGGVFLGRGGEKDLEAGKEGEKVVEENAAPAESKPADDPAAKTQENRFLLISVAFNEARFPEPEMPASMKEAAPGPPADGAPVPPAPPVEGSAPASPTESAPPATPEKPAETPASAPAEGANPIKNIAYQEPAKETAPASTPPAEVSPAAAPPAEAKPAEGAPAATEPLDPEAQKKLEEEMKARVEMQKKIDAEREKSEYETKKKERDRHVEEGRKKAKELEARYGQWFYVVSNDSAKKVRLTRVDLVKKPEPKKEGEGAPPSAPPADGAAPAPAETPAPAESETPAPETPAPSETPATEEAKPDASAPK
jgi:hypothetical protein